MISIDEQIHYQKQTVALAESRGFDAAPEKAILASLERLKAIESVQVPEEPLEVVETRRQITEGYKRHWWPVINHIDTLRDLLRLNAYQRDWAMKQMVANFDRAEAAEAKLADEEVAHKRLRQSWNELDIKIKAMLKLGENPSEEMRDAGRSALVDLTTPGH
jgi:hypothetical protein